MLDVLARNRELLNGLVAAFADGKIEAYVGPPELGAADDLEAVIVDFIDGARSLARHRGAGARLRADRAGDPRRALARGPRQPLPRAGLPAQRRCKRQAGRRLPRRSRARRPSEALAPRPVGRGRDRVSPRTAGSSPRCSAPTSRCKGDFNPKIFHQKFVLRDFRDGQATTPGNPALLSGSANFTFTDTHRNLNHVFVFRNSNVCRQYELEIEQLTARTLRPRDPRRRAEGLRPRRRTDEGALRTGAHARARDHEADAQGRAARSSSRSSRSPAPPGSTTRCSRSRAAG